MTGLEEIPRTPQELVKKIGAAQVVLAVLPANTGEKLAGAVRSAREGIEMLAPETRAVLLHGAGSVGESPAIAELAGERLHPLSYPLLEQDALADPVRGLARAFRAVLAIAADFGARASVLISSDLASLSPQKVFQLIRPALELDFDLVTPLYSHSKFEGLLTSGVIAPLIRALYGKRLCYPLGPDFGMSARMGQRLLETVGRERGRIRGWPLPASAALTAGFEVCQANLGVRRYPTMDWMDLSSAIAQVLEPLFQDADENVAFWQRIRGSKAVPEFGQPAPAPEDSGSVDVRRMIESFDLGCRSLMEVWGLVLPPGTLMELRRASRLAVEQFRIPDQLWAHVVYDFALGYHLKTMNPDHLLRSMTPLYLAWVASYALEMENAAPGAVEQRLERLSAAFEAAKPYFLSRWRWPDRFNP